MSEQKIINELSAKVVELCKRIKELEKLIQCIADSNTVAHLSSDMWILFESVTVGDVSR